MLAESVARIAMGHGLAICTLTTVGTTTTTIALLRIQYEELVRAAGLYFAARHEWIHESAITVRNKELKDLNFPTITAMLKALEKSNSPPVGRPVCH